MRAFENQGAYALLMPKEGNIMTPTQSSGLAADINQKRGQTLVTNGAFDFFQLGMSPVDMNIVETLQLSKQDICMLYGLDSILFNDHSSATFSNKDEDKRASIVNGVA